MAIASVVGWPIKINVATQKLDSEKHAKRHIEVNLALPMVTKV